ncbi:response regulator [Candidatus Saccharibacteria bacterium]|jgi:two-component system phosphate regulon response regulator PhoB|nr:response regulator [Candidatus Saccharibacteria bacterium]
MTKITIIEDDPTISQMYRMKFEADGFDVRIANNGEIGVEVVRSFKPDVILLDLQMPEMNGTEALRAIRADDSSKTTPVIILTNLGEEEAPREMRALGVHSYIVKANYTPRQVVAQVKEIIDGTK